MKPLLVLFVALLLVFASLKADAKRLSLKEKRKLIMAERHFLSETKTGQKNAYNAGANDAKDVTSNKDTETTDDDETNSNYGSYGSPSGSGTGSHHYYTRDQKPPAEN